MTALYPGARWRPVPNHSGPMSAHLGLILHVQVGNGSVYGEFSNPTTSASYTWWVSKAGLIEQYVDAELVAWAQAAGNGTYNSVGTEGFPNEPLTDAQAVAIAGIYAWGSQLYGWAHQLAEAPGQPGFGWHGMGDSNGHSGWGGHPACPGDLRKAQRQHILDLPQGPTPVPPTRKRQTMLVMTAPNHPEYLVGGGFKTWITDPADVPGLLEDTGQKAPRVVNANTLRAIPFPPGTPTDLMPA